ncbi:hypothetical protein F4811DRAFT_554203 [Daldinia bambusicola]|nr:hypothetical protein F4811DRAFT_554203 [Daldinia bambusicola]
MPGVTSCLPSASHARFSANPQMQYNSIDTTVNGGVTTTWLFSTVFTKFAPIPATTVVLITTEVDGGPTTLSFTTTYLQIADNWTTSIGNQNSTRSPTSSATSIPSLPLFNAERAKPTSHAWIAGPVVGGFAVLSIIAINSWLLWRRRRKRLEARAKTELPGESAMKTELDAPNRPQELDAVNSQKKNEAMITKEPQELQAS